MKHNILKRKLITLAVSTALVASMLTGCGSTEDSTETLAVESGESVTMTTIEATHYELPTTSEATEIYVEPIDDLSDDFYRGMDASAVLSIENSGATYYNFDGEEADVFQTLAEAGVNYIRLRVWNDPYDEDGNGYGGGNCDIDTALALGTRATQYGMKVCIDFHYSDFWADPKRQHAPKAWEGMTIDEKADALYTYTVDSLTQLLNAGVDVGMVQIGNEINNGMSGETDPNRVTTLLEAGSRAVREVAATFDHDIKVAVHYTNIEDQEEIDTIAARLQAADLDYDLFGLSFYTFWDGTFENMQEVVTNLRENYGKDVYIAETSYCYTAEDGDGFSNSLSGDGDTVEGYGATVQSQASMIRDVCAAANEAGALGVFYWEGTWIPVGSADADNSALWEQYGSGWASSYSADYDPDDAGLYYGGSSWDNQAMFDFTGHPLASLNVWKYLHYGATADLAVDYVPDVNVTCNVGSEISLPEAIPVIYNDRSANTEVAVTWDAEEIAAIDVEAGGTYTIDGALEDGTSVSATVEIEMINYVLNPSFEDADRSMWNIIYNEGSDYADYQEKAADAYSGDVAFHFWRGDGDMDFAIEQTITDLEPGTYQLYAYSQGGDFDDTASMELYAVTADGEQTDGFTLTTYADWKNPTIDSIKVTDGTLTIGVRLKCNVSSWGTVDDFTLNRIGD